MQPRTASCTSPGLQDISDLLQAVVASSEPVSRELHVERHSYARSRVEFALQRPQSADSRGYRGQQTALCEAAFAGNVEVVRLLLEASAQTSLCDGRGRTPLQWAAEAGHEEVASALMEAGADMDRFQGGTPLQVAACKGHTGMVRLLLEAGADKEKVSNHVPDTPLKIASGKGFEEMVRILLVAGADKDGALNISPFDTGTPLQAACREGHVGIVRLLLEAGANANKVSQRCREKPLQIAFTRRHLDIARLLGQG